MPVAFIQEFAIQDGDTSTTNYDAVVAELDLKDVVPDGLLIHTAGFDRDAGVFRIFDVWQTREQGEKFINDLLGPVTGRLAVAAADRGDVTFTPPNREGWYDLHDSVPG